ncbi:hypothetical protein N7457_004833 [Penicillium paradoxum]|uniref:uncharacterized protein n=1 Tax=Penicillium paradoxum TaxID=176176 RepID=UPI0025477DE7|nr:uncharacterized protein N7457_004833 [Penicillium paradoxum]KAJ5783059.1 hypothetical protein N7457_004833 [Penicillium paradoxum]
MQYDPLPSPIPACSMHTQFRQVMSPAESAYGKAVPEARELRKILRRVSSSNAGPANALDLLFCTRDGLEVVSSLLSPSIVGQWMAGVA